MVGEYLWVQGGIKERYSDHPQTTILQPIIGSLDVLRFRVSGVGLEGLYPTENYDETPKRKDVQDLARRCLETVRQIVLTTDFLEPYTLDPTCGSNNVQF